MPSTVTIAPFANESEVISIGDLTIENRVDKISVYGSLAISKDKTGLELARQLMNLSKVVVATLEKDKDLPQSIKLSPAESVKNPFD